MDELILGFDNFKISALSKSMKINPYVTNVTLGPNSTILQAQDEQTVPDMVETKPPKEATTTYHKQHNSGLVLNKFLAEIEQQRQEKVQQAINSHLNCMVEFSKTQKCHSKQQFEKQQQALLNGVQQQELLILQALEQHDKDMSVQHQQLVQYYQQLAERRRKNDQELQEKEKRRQQISLIIDGIKKDQIEFRNTFQEIINVIRTCKYQNQLKAALGDIPKQLKSIPEAMDEVIARCKAGRISEVESKKSNESVKDIKGLLEAVKKKIECISELQANNKAKSESVTASAPIPEEKPKQSAVSSAPTTTNTNAMPSNTQLNKFISLSSLKIYSELQDYLENWTKSFNQLTGDDSFKQFRFDCKKAVNIPVNAISAVNSHHLLDKYNRLSHLLSGKLVEVGGTKVIASKHPQGIAFCMDLLAKKFVLQGDLMISSNPEAAFAYAAIITALWNEFATFGKLLLAHFYQECPYLVPFYPPRAIGQTDEEYYTSQGYQYTDGVVEKQDKFLKRMTGIMRLYTAIIIQKPRRGQRNPYGLHNGWRWLASFLNLDPKPDITATMLHVFLENAGSTFQNVYGKVFQRMIAYVYKIYLPMIQKIDTGGPVTRLEVLLQDYLKQGQFETPHGMLPANFW